MMFHFKKQNFIDMYHCFFLPFKFHTTKHFFFSKCVATPVKKHICAIIKTSQDFLKIGVLDFSPHLITCTNIADLTLINLSVPQFTLVLFCQERMIL